MKMNQAKTSSPVKILLLTFMPAAAFLCRGPETEKGTRQRTGGRTANRSDKSDKSYEIYPSA